MFISFNKKWIERFCDEITLIIWTDNQKSLSKISSKNRHLCNKSRNEVKMLEVYIGPNGYGKTKRLESIKQNLITSGVNSNEILFIE